MSQAAIISRSVKGLPSHKLSRRWYVGYVAALAAVSVVSLLIGLVLGQVNLANSSMLYLLAVMASAVAFGRGPAVFASVATFLVFDWFFVEPLHQFTNRHHHVADRRLRRGGTSNHVVRFSGWSSRPPATNLEDPRRTNNLMHPTLLHEIETMLQAPPTPAKLKCAAPLEIAARMLSTAAPYQMTSTIVVGVLGCDDADAFHTIVSDIGEEYGCEAAVKIQRGSYSVRFSRPPESIIH